MELVSKAPISHVENPLCTVCIANYNGETLLGACLDSVLAQDCDSPVEVIVHDDASTDASVAFLREHYPQIKVLTSDRNVGFCVANNRMVAQARGDYVVLLNNDAALYSDALTTLLHTAHEQATPGILSLPQYDWETGTLVDRGCLLDPFYNPVPNRNPKRSEVAYVIGACLWIPRSLWNDLGGFPEWMESIAEDMYLCCIARLRGHPVRVLDSSGYRHRQGASFGGNRMDQGKLRTTFHRRRLSERNKTAVMIICTPSILVWLLFTLHIASLFLEGSVLTVLKRDGGIWRQIYAPTLRYLFSRLDQLRENRKQEQQKRYVSIRTYLCAFVAVPRKFILLLKHGIPELR
jgi:GT2 family glycosyltransferase